MRTERIALVGMMGAGKSSVARMLADRLSWPLVEVDAVVAERAGKSIAELFAVSGEEAFRELEEAEALAALSGASQVVVDLGGGAPTREATRSALRDGATVVWLRASAETLAARVGKGSGRPLLGADPLVAITALNEARAEAYESVADYVLDVDDLSTREVCDRIVVLTSGER